jgi:hypothetical protein
LINSERLNQLSVADTWLFNPVGGSQTWQNTNHRISAVERNGGVLEHPAFHSALPWGMYLSGCSQSLPHCGLDTSLSPVSYKMNCDYSVYFHVPLSPYEVTKKELKLSVNKHFLKCVPRNAECPEDTLEIRTLRSSKFAKCFQKLCAECWGYSNE